MLFTMTFICIYALLATDKEDANILTLVLNHHGWMHIFNGAMTPISMSVIILLFKLNKL